MTEFISGFELHTGRYDANMTVTWQQVKSYFLLGCFLFVCVNFLKEKSKA